MHRHFLGAAVCALALNLMTPAQAQTSDTFVGSAIPVAETERSIVIGPDTKWANVKRREAVRFVIGEREFGWRFDGRDSSVDLMRVAPPGLLNRPFMVYIAQPMGDRP